MAEETNSKAAHVISALLKRGFTVKIKLRKKSFLLKELPKMIESQAFAKSVDSKDKKKLIEEISSKSVALSLSKTINGDLAFGFNFRSSKTEKFIICTIWISEKNINKNSLKAIEKILSILY